MTQSQLGRLVGLTAAGINKMIRREQMPRADVLFRVATALDVSVEYFAPPDYTPGEPGPPSTARINALLADLSVSERMMAIGALEMWKAMRSYNPDESLGSAPESEPVIVH